MPGNRPRVYKKHRGNGCAGVLVHGHILLKWESPKRRLRSGEKKRQLSDAQICGSSKVRSTRGNVSGEEVEEVVVGKDGSRSRSGGGEGSTRNEGDGGLEGGGRGLEMVGWKERKAKIGYPLETGIRKDEQRETLLDAGGDKCVGVALPCLCGRGGSGSRLCLFDCYRVGWGPGKTTVRVTYSVGKTVAGRGKARKRQARFLIGRDSSPSQ